MDSEDHYDPLYSYIFDREDALPFTVFYRQQVFNYIFVGATWLLLIVIATSMSGVCVICR